MKTIRFAVLGPHRRGKISLMAHRPEDGLQLVAVCATHLDGLDEYTEKCGEGVFQTTDYREILARPDIDAVFICTPDHLHVKHAQAALRAGKYVFLEKPIAISIKDADAILRTATEVGKDKLYVGHNMRFFPVVRKMRELIEQGCIGRVEAIWCRHFISYGGDAYFKDWHSERRYTHSLLLQKAAHDIDVMHYLGGSYTSRVVGMGKLSVYSEVTDRLSPDEVGVASVDVGNWPPLEQKGLSAVTDVEDHSMLLMQFVNGVQASYQQCHYTPDDVRNYTIIGTHGRIENYGDTSEEGNLARVHLWNTRTGKYRLEGDEVFEIAPLSGTHGGSDVLMIDDFINHLRGKRSIGATPWDARMAVATGYLGTESLRNGSMPFDVPGSPLA